MATFARAAAGAVLGLSLGALLNWSTAAAACNDSKGDTWHRECVKVTWEKPGGWRLRNICNTKLELVWCVRGADHAPCKPRPWWWGAQWSASPGKTWYVPARGGTEIEYNACHYHHWK
ncbi:MAG: hypothetical protein ACQEVT_04270 [Pseudomonadota bacterium]